MPRHAKTIPAACDLYRAAIWRPQNCTTSTSPMAAADPWTVPWTIAEWHQRVWEDSWHPPDHVRHIRVRRLNGELFEVSLPAQEANKIELIRDLKECLAKNDPCISPVGQVFFQLFFFSMVLASFGVPNAGSIRVHVPSLLIFVFIRNSGQGLLERPVLICCVRLTHMGVEINDGAPVNWEWLEEGRVGRQTAFQSKKS